MTDTFSRWAQPIPPAYASGRAGLPRGALDGVRTRRMLAVCVDFTLVSILCFGLWLALLVLTFGLSLVLLPTDTAVLCWAFALWGAPTVFAAVYAALFAANLLHTAVSMQRKHRRLTR